jgi:hypothetical protein
VNYKWEHYQNSVSRVPARESAERIIILICQKSLLALSAASLVLHTMPALPVGPIAVARFSCQKPASNIKGGALDKRRLFIFEK